MNNKKIAGRKSLSTQFSVAEVREALSSSFTTSEISAGQEAMRRFRSNLTSEIQEVNVLARLLSEKSAAERAIDKKLMAVSFYSGGGVVPGAPQGDLQYGGGDGVGFYQIYEDGAIFWQRDRGAWWVHGDIYGKYRALGAEAGFLGYPLTDETPTADGVGRFNHFERGSIYWHPNIGAFEMHGDIRSKWRALGSEAFGYPVTDETATGDGLGRFNHFRDVVRGGTDASIYWGPVTGSHVVRGAIRERWAQLGWENSYLGYPVTDQDGWIDPETHNTGLINHFQRGAVTWTAEGQDVVEFPERIVLRSGHIGVSSVGGWVELVLTSAGTFNYRGHLHNSGAVGFHCTIASGVLIPGKSQALMVTKEVNTGGTFSFDGRDEDWDDSGYEPQLRANWDTLRLRDTLTMTTDINAMLGAADFFLLVFLPLIGAVTVISLVVGGKPPDTHCETSGMHTVTDGNNHTIAEPNGVRCGLPGPPRKKP